MAQTFDMNAPTTHAGGFFLIFAILGGSLWGALSGTLLFGAVVGTAIGIVLALAVWLVDRRRR